MTFVLRPRTPSERFEWLVQHVAVLTARIGALERWRSRQAPMDGTRLTTAADALDTLADEVAGFANTASEAALDVAERVRSVGGELREIAAAAGDDAPADEEVTLEAAPDTPETPETAPTEPLDPETA